VVLKQNRFVFIRVSVLCIVYSQNGINTLVTVLHFYHYHCQQVANYFFKPVPNIIQHIAGLCDVTNGINVNDFPELLIGGDSGCVVLDFSGLTSYNDTEKSMRSRISQHIIIMFMETNKSILKQYKTYTFRNQALFCSTGFNKAYFENSFNNVLLLVSCIWVITNVWQINARKST